MDLPQALFGGRPWRLESPAPVFLASGAPTRFRHEQFRYKHLHRKDLCVWPPETGPSFGGKNRTDEEPVHRPGDTDHALPDPSSSPALEAQRAFAHLPELPKRLLVRLRP